MSADPFPELQSAALAWGAPLDGQAVARLKTYLQDVREKNATTNLTADDAWEDLVLKHAADGVLAAGVLKRHLRPGRPRPPRILDLGAGGGFIGFSLKIAWPEADVSLMEAVERKYRFLNAAAAKLGLAGLRPLLRRAGASAPRTSYDSGFDVVIERALAPLPEAVSLALPLLAPDGLFAAFQSDPIDPADPMLARALAAGGARVLESFVYRRPREERERRLVIFARGGN